DVSNSQYVVQLLRGHFHGAGGGSCTGSWLWEGRRHRRVKGDVAFDFLQNLVDVAIQHGDRAEAFQQAQSLLTILGDPSPGGVDGPQGDVGEDDEGRAAGEPCDIVFEPVQLVLTEAAQARCLEVQDVDEPDEMHALVVKALPAIPRGPLPVAVEKLLPAIKKDVMLAGHVKYLAGINTFEALSERVERPGFLAMGEVPGVQEKGRRRLQCIDLGDGQLQRRHDVGIRLALEADMRIANLYKDKISACWLSCR